MLVAELAINVLEDDTCHEVVTLPEDEQATLEQIESHSEGLFGEKIPLPEPS